MEVLDRRAREKQAIRQSILDAASQLIVEQGYQNLSLRKIAEKIEYAPSTIYLYFQDKFEIIATICVEVFNILTAKLEHLHATQTDPVSGLRQGLRCYIEFGLEHPSYYQVTFLIPTPDLPPDHPAMIIGPDLAGRRCFDCLRRGIQLGIDAGMFRKEDSILLAQATWLAIHGLVSGIICMGDEPKSLGPDRQFPWVARERLIDGQIDLLIRGLLIQPEAP